MAQQPAPFKLAPPPGYRQSGGVRPGVVNPAADRSPVASTGGQVMYFHKPADSLAPDANPNLPPVETQSASTSNAALVPSVLPAEMISPNDQRLAQAPALSPRSVYEPREMPVSADVPSSTAPVSAPPAAARAEESVKTAPMPVVPTSPAPATTTRTSQKKQDLPKPPDRIDNSYATRLPARDKIFVIYDDQDLERAIIASVRSDVQRRMKDGGKREEFKDDDKYYRFPELARLVPEGTVYQAKTDQYPPRTECYEAPYVVHRRLGFEQKNVERGGWDLGVVQPVVSTLAFYKDVVMWPHNLASGVHNCWDTSAGKCLPGSPTPFYLYPPEVTLTGTVAEVGIITATAFIFP